MPLVFPQPPITTFSSHALTFTFAFCYVGSLYISKNARLSFVKTPEQFKNEGARPRQMNERWRDDPEVIQARLLAAGTATAVCCGLVFALLRHIIQHNSQYAVEATATRLGFDLNLHFGVPYPHLVTPVLFLGPLFVKYLGGYLPFQRNWSFKQDIVQRLFCWVGFRNYIAGPVTEEIVFRSCVLAVYHLAGISRQRMIFLAPLSFGLAHVHHAWDTFNRYGRTTTAVKMAVLSTLFQLAYTTIFGFHCSFLFLRTSSIYPPITAHFFCNLMGFPDLGLELRAYPRRKKEILFAYVLGVIGFVFVLRPWTRTPGSLYWDMISVD